MDVPKRFEFNEEKQNYPRRGYRFLGLGSLTDPPRPTAPDSVSKLRSASIKVMMVTGDHPTTAVSVARAVGIFSEGWSLVNEDLSEAVLHLHI